MAGKAATADELPGHGGEGVMLFRSMLDDRRRTSARQGFVMIMTLVLVALAGLIMVETAPDFSNYAVLARAREFRDNLSRIRRIGRSRPFFIRDADGIDPSDPSTGVIVTAELYKALAATAVSSGAAIPSTCYAVYTSQPLPRDPYVPANEWYSTTSPQKKFWRLSWNMVRNPSFFEGTRAEGWLEDAFDVFFLRSGAIYRCNRFGGEVRQVVRLSGASISDFSLSPDGSKIAFVTDYYAVGSGEDIFTVGTKDYVVRPITNTGADPAFGSPLWSSCGDAIACTMYRPLLGRRDVAILRPEPSAMPVIVTTGVNPDYVGNLSWSSDGRYLAYIYHQGGAAYVGVYDWLRKAPLVPPASSPFRTWYDPLFHPKAITPRWSSSGYTLLYAAYDTTATGNRSLHVVRKLHVYPYHQEEDLGLEGMGPFVWPPASAGLGGELYPGILAVAGGDMIFARVFPSYSGFAVPAYSMPGPPEIVADSVHLSQKGAVVAFVVANGASRYMAWGGIDGFWPRSIPSLNDIDKVVIGPLKHHWCSPPSLVRKMTPRERAVFDSDVWNAFVRENGDYKGDFKFGDGWMRLSPPEYQDIFLFDDGYNVCCVQLSSGASPRIFKYFPSKTDPSIDWKAASYVAKEAVDPTGGEASDLFKQAFSLATTLIVGKGYWPAVSPDDLLVAVSVPAAYSTTSDVVSTSPPDSTTYPIEDLDIWVMNVTGAPVPKPRNLTPATPHTYDSHPCWSPDGRYVYFQRESQDMGPYLTLHNSSIYRVTRDGGVITSVVEGGSIVPEWSEGKWNSSIEMYFPAVSPDGTRLAFIGKERLKGYGGLAHTVSDPYEEGDVITECLFVKDLLFNSPPVMLLRVSCGFSDFSTSTSYYGNVYLDASVSETKLQSMSLSSPCWTPDGEEIVLCATWPMNHEFPRRMNERLAPSSSSADKRGYYDISTEQYVIAVPASISHFDASKQYPSGLIEPPGNNYRILAQNTSPAAHGSSSLVLNWAVVPGSSRKIFNVDYSHGAYLYQRVVTDTPFMSAGGVSAGVWYILSGYLRTSTGSEDLRSAQLMVELLNNRGVPISLGSGKIYQIGYPDIGASVWTRFSAAVRFDKTYFGAADSPPYSVLLMIYTNGPPGSWVDVTGLKLEKAYDDEHLRPTAFSFDWTIFSGSLDMDPLDPGYYLFEK